MSDGYAARYPAQADLRQLVNDLTTPVIPVKKLAHAAGVTERTIWSFREGHRSLNPTTERAIRAAVRELIQEVNAKE